MLAMLILALPLALIWMIVTTQITLGGFGVGYVVGVAILRLIQFEAPTTALFHWRKLPAQIGAFVIYCVILLRDIWLATWDVTKRVLNPALPMNPGILAVPTQDEDENEVIAAFSAHGITITPGELVVDYHDQQIMFVHCLDIEASSQSAPGAQTKRLGLLRRVLGREEN